MVGNHPLHGLGFEQDEASALFGKDHSKCTNNGVNIVLDGVIRKFHLEDANKFAQTLKNVDEVVLGFKEATNASGECHFTHRIAYGDVLETIINMKSEALLDEMQICYPNILNELNYLIIYKHIRLSIPLVDKNLTPPKRKFYPLSELDFKELHKQFKVMVDSSRIVTYAIPYGEPIFFAVKKRGPGLWMCTDYHSLNSNTTTNSFSLPRIDELLERLYSSKVFF